MPDYSVLYPGRFLKKEALAAPKVIRIDAIAVTQLEGERGVENKVVMKYSAADGKGEIVLCKTNAELIAQTLNERDYEKWVGHYVTIYNNPNVDLGGRKVGGIRIFGGPEMKGAKTVEIKRPRRKKGEIYRLVPTDNKGAPKNGAASSEPSMVVGEDIEPPISGEEVSA
jgi:hypothetical protein